jgi:hypothetical protein
MLFSSFICSASHVYITQQAIFAVSSQSPEQCGVMTVNDMTETEFVIYDKYC